MMVAFLSIHAVAIIRKSQEVCTTTFPNHYEYTTILLLNYSSTSRIALLDPTTMTIRYLLLLGLLCFSS